jgi:hypothetical protein
VNILRSAFRKPQHPNLATWHGPLGLHAQLDYVSARRWRRRRCSGFEPDGSDHYPPLRSSPSRHRRKTRPGL